MAYYEGFEARKVTREGDIVYRIRTVDLYEVESWEEVDEEHVKVFTKSGDSFIIRVALEEFTNICMSSVDEYGRLFTFYSN